MEADVNTFTPSRRADASERLLTFARAVFEKWAVVEEHEKEVYSKAARLLRKVCARRCILMHGAGVKPSVIIPCRFATTLNTERTLKNTPHRCVPVRQTPLRPKVAAFLRTFLLSTQATLDMEAAKDVEGLVDNFVYLMTLGGFD